MKFRALSVVFVVCLGFAVSVAQAETPREYENRIKVMLELAVRLDDYARQNLGDRGLLGYVHAVAETNVGQASRLAPPPAYAALHPHLVIVLENVERALYFAAKGDMGRYRKHIKTLRKEIGLLESLADKAGLTVFAWDLAR